ncbi:hypothetical protein Taro_017790 [Colocasia esculenta]|uniref:Uncharacterized protein n=1 Tax=Colocasia esculenta TaxID=4460 RepID=A0A843UUB1_COLES|nr:hypothetical protein [Colocasia esculenta]
MNEIQRLKLGDSYTTLGAYLKAHQMKSGDYLDEYTRVLCAIMEGERGRGLGWSKALPWSEHMRTQTSNEGVKHLSFELQIAKTEIEAMRAREKEMEEREKVRERGMQEMKDVRNYLLW